MFLSFRKIGRKHCVRKTKPCRKVFFSLTENPDQKYSSKDRPRLPNRVLCKMSRKMHQIRPNREGQVYTRSIQKLPSPISMRQGPGL